MPSAVPAKPCACMTHCSPASTYSHLLTATHDTLKQLTALTFHASLLGRDDIISVCLSSAFHATKEALPYMLEQKWGRIINTGAAVPVHRHVDEVSLHLALCRTGACGYRHVQTACPGIAHTLRSGARL